MQVGMIGLGRMGANMVRRLMRGGHECVAHDVSAAAVKAIAAEGARGAASLDDFVSHAAGAAHGVAHGARGGRRLHARRAVAPARRR